MSDDSAPQYVVRGEAVYSDNPVPKYWTGRMLESWPEYVHDKDRAHTMREQTAKEVARSFNERVHGMMWTAEAA
jgi:hypothetical protein